MKKYKIIILSFCYVLLSVNSFSQQKINLSQHVQNSNIQAVNRMISLYQSPSDAVELNAMTGDGLGILKEVPFEKGVIEIDLLGENNPGKSFIGIAFNIQDEKTYEAVYFRPFNFMATEPLRKSHMVQYIAHPDFPWSKLRNERTGVFENEIVLPPNPNDWFKAFIKISTEKVEVYVNDIEKPVLSVNRLSTPKSNKIGLWVGTGSSGRYRNLMITKE